MYRSSRVHSLDNEPVRGKLSTTIRHARELSSLTALRGLAALAVLIFHCGVGFGGIGGPLGIAIGHGYLAVDLFFMISGFVLTHVYGQTFGADFGWADIRPFLWARFARIYPVHVVTLILLLPFYGNQGFSGAALAENLLFIQIFLAPTLTWNGGAWSISAEWYAYLLFPFIVTPLLDRSGRMSAIRMLGLCLASPAILIIIAGTGNIAVGPIVLARALPEFVVGMLLYHCFVSNWLVCLWRSDAICFSCLFVIVCVAAIPNTEIPTIALLAALLLCCAHNRRKVAALLHTGPVLFLGKISYSLYMFQAPAYFSTLEMRSQGIVTNPAALGALMAVLSFAMAVPISVYIEYPTRALLKGMLRSGTARTTL